MKKSILSICEDLPKHSSLIYSHIHENGPILVAHIARDLKLPRASVYRALDDLVLANFIRIKRIGKRKYYEACKTKDSHEHEPQPDLVQVFSGESCISAVYNDIVEHCEEGDTFYRYTSEQDLDQINALLPKDYREKREHKHLERMVISNRASGEQKKSRLERFIKYIPEDQYFFKQNIIQLVYGNKLAFIDVNVMQAFVIENAELAAFQKVIFRHLYKKL